jgi:hypothetical protein
MNNISPTKWGPSFWYVFHITAFGYPTNPTESDIEYYRTYYNTFAKVIPCVVCREHFGIMLSGTYRLTDEIMADREKLIRWTWEVHDYVNRKKKVSIEWTRTKSPSYNIFHKYFDNLLV